MKTAVGIVFDALGQGQRRVGVEGKYGVEFRTRSWATPAGGFRKTQPARIPLNLGHEPGLTIGKVVHLERGKGGQLFAVALVERDFDPPADTRIFFSGETDSFSDGTDTILTGLALTLAPAQTGLQPITLLPGAPVEAARRVVYQHGFVGELTKRAAAVRRRTDDPIVVVDPPPKIEQVGTDAWLVNDELVARTGRMYGQLHYGPPGRIISVR